MNREQLRSRASGRIEKFRLDDGSEVFIRPLSALDRARILDRYKEIRETQGDKQNLEEVIKSQCFILTRSIVDGESKKLLYPEDDETVVADEIDWPSMDAIAARVIEISGMAVKDEAEKNLQPTPSGDSNSD
jgi:hypothetical protein